MYFLLKNGYNVNGGLFMAAARRIELTLPEGLLETVDSIAKKENITRSECIESAMRFYIEEREKRDLRDQMIQGYQEMAEINITILEDFFSAEQELWFTKE